MKELIGNNCCLVTTTKKNNCTVGGHQQAAIFDFSTIVLYKTCAQPKPAVICFQIERAPLILIYWKKR